MKLGALGLSWMLVLAMRPSHAADKAAPPVPPGRSAVIPARAEAPSRRAPAPEAPSLEDSTMVAFKASRVPPPPSNARGVVRATDARAERVRDIQAIVGGVEATPGRWPFAIAIAYRNQQGTLTQYCGGSLISPTTVLTAAHCQASTGHYAIIGRHDLSTRKGRALRIVAVTSHVGFDEQSFQNDISLLRLAAPVTEFTPVQLATPDMMLQEGQAVTAIGWGRTREGGSSSLVLREVTLPVARHDECVTQYETKYPITPDMLCASAPGTKDTCQGDSGGPLLMTTSDGKVVQVGITSFGIGCARPAFHGVYTRVSSFRKWIDDPLSP
ncbi:serine protease [Myxococcus sp. RHSTA-1-4]|uniref:serine protease n=1 Tax=Myxococcus sp. RHSTA-1-4 TaxID=2874601 RepID=UPI001CBCD26A|nr:serine protease [Myxococcus sp. RHSTA-1-4]MBZ4416188.1 trypsin-like serine protease [Myxococcus sp. RHSTA-1-4]